jgi:hypothetical protein
MKNSVIGRMRCDKGEAAIFAGFATGMRILPGIDLKPRQNVAFSTYIE